MTGTLIGAIGTGASFTLLGSDFFGGVSITTGTGTSGHPGITLSCSDKLVAFTTAPPVVLVPLNANAESTGASVASATPPVGQTLAFAIELGTVADNTTYQFAYLLG